MALTIKELKHDNYERVVEFSDDCFHCFIAIHNTKLGRALGGCRIKPYNHVSEALTDVLRLAKGMTYKSSLAGLNLGGGKCVVMAEKATRDIMLKVGEAVNHFDGLYITAEDVGTTLPDIQTVAEISPHVVHLDGSSNTALGVLSCMKAAIKHHHVYGDSLKGVPIWIQGLGKVGYDLLSRLFIETGSELNGYVSDLRPEIVQKAMDEFYVREITDADKRFMAIYAPCAMGQVINSENINRIQYSIICGSANNQLLHDEYADVLQRKAVLYCPDYLVNAGGVITAAGEIANWTADEVVAKCEGLGDRLIEVFELADDKITPLAAANKLAENRWA
jgi:leucine dehydrogenase